MIADRIENDSDALRELAAWILRDGVDCGHLESYMHTLLDKHLVELSASCRYGAMKAIGCCKGLGSVDVAGYLCEMATRMELECPSLGQSRLPNCARSSALGITPVRTLGQNISVGSRRFSWLPELIAAVAFTTVGFLLMPTDCGDVALHAFAAGLYVVVGFIHAGVAIHSAWQIAHTKGSNL